MSSRNRTRALICALSLALAGMSATALSAQALTTNATGDPNITDTMISISGTPTGVSGEHPFRAYRVGSYSNAQVKDGVLKSVDVTTNAKYAEVAKQALAATGQQSNDPIAYVSAAFSDPQDNTKPWTSNPQLRSFTDALAKAIDNSSENLEPDANFTYKEGSFHFEVDEGIWLLIDDQGIDMGATFGSLPILVSTDASNASFDSEHPLGTVNLKNQNVPTVELSFAEKKNDQIVRTDHPDFALNDTFYTQAVSTIPYYTGYEKGQIDYALTLAFGEDAGEDGDGGMQPDASDIEATVTSADGKTVQHLAQDRDYSFEQSNIATFDFGNYINGKGSAQPLEGGTLTLNVKTKFTDEVIFATPSNPQGNPATASLLYSSTPTNLTHTAQACANGACAYGTQNNYIYAYTYGYNVAKTDKNDQSKLLGGAQFDVNGDGKADYTTSTEGDTLGRFTVNGVDSGTQTVNEIKAPEGYQNTALPKFSFTIEPTFVNGATAQQKVLQKLTYSDDQGDTLNLVSHKAGSNDYQVANAKTLTQLPLTGGAGIAASIIAGLLLACVGICRIVRACKSRK